MKRIQISALFVLLLVVCVYVAPKPACGAEKVFNLRFVHMMAATTPQGKVAQDWCKEIEKRTNGRVKITFYPSGVVVPVPQIYDGVAKQVVDIGWAPLMYARGRFPLSEVIDLPLGYKNGHIGTELANAFYNKFKPKELDDVRILHLEGSDPGVISLRKPIARLEDLKGLKIRTGGTNNKIIEALGATPVSMALGDAYDALSKGVADGTVSSIGGVFGYGLADVVRYHVENYSTAYSSGIFVAINKNRWNALPSDIQAIIMKVDEEFLNKFAQSWVQWEMNGINGLKQKGNTFIKLSPEEEARWVEKMKPVLADYVTYTKSRGVPGEEALKFCEDYLRTYNR